MEEIAQMIATYRETSQHLEVFDFNLWWDPIFRDGFRIYTDWDKQWEDYNQFGLKNGLITSAKAARYDGLEGNAELSALIDGTPLLGCMVLTPELFYSQGGDEYVDTLVSQGFVAARLFPATYMHSMKPADIGSLLEVLETRGVPLLLWHTQVSFDEMDCLCRAYPGLNIVVEGHDRKLLYHARQYMPLLMRHKNFFLETHNIVLYREFENIDSLAGSSNLLYGSYFPYLTPHFSLYPVITAEIGEAQRSGILCGNARRILRAAGGKQII